MPVAACTALTLGLQGSRRLPRPSLPLPAPSHPSWASIRLGRWPHAGHGGAWLAQPRAGWSWPCKYHLGCFNHGKSLLINTDSPPNYSGVKALLGAGRRGNSPFNQSLRDLGQRGQPGAVTARLCLAHRPWGQAQLPSH